MNLENAIAAVNQFQSITDLITEQHSNIQKIDWEIKGLAIETLKELRSKYTNQVDHNNPFAKFSDGRLFFVSTISENVNVVFISKPMKVVQTYEEI